MVARGLLGELGGDELEAFRRAHLSRIAALADAHGVRLHVPSIWMASGQKP